jgi:D-alanyl-D-alanine carboxypeptidase
MKFGYVLLLLMLCTSAHSQVAGVQAKSYIVLDDQGNTIVEKDSKTPHPIASITKLLISEQILLNPLDRVIIEKDDIHSRSIKVHSIFSEEQLLELALIPSNNTAIYALARQHDMEMTINSVNDAAKTRGLFSIHIEEPSGLSINNVGSAEDIAKSVQYIKDTQVAMISTNAYTFNHIHSTNPFLGKVGWQFILSKTGYTNPAGGCVASVLMVGGKEMTVVILGSKNVYTRWTDLVLIRMYLYKESFWQETKIKRKKHV